MLEMREGGCHCGRVRFRARVDLDLLSQCNCSICTKKGILHLPIAPEDFELLRGKNALTAYTFGTGVAQHTFCSHCGMHAFYIPRSHAGPGDGQRALSRRDRRAEPEADPLFRGPPLGGGAAPPAGARRAPIAARPQRRGDTAAHPGARAGIIEARPSRITTRAVAEPEPSARRLDRTDCEFRRRRAYRAVLPYPRSGSPRTRPRLPSRPAAHPSTTLVPRPHRANAARTALADAATAGKKDEPVVHLRRCFRLPA